MRCVLEGVRLRSVHCYGIAASLSFCFYMLVFHTLSNLPLDQPLYFEASLNPSRPKPST